MPIGKPSRAGYLGLRSHAIPRVLHGMQYLFHGSFYKMNGLNRDNKGKIKKLLTGVLFLRVFGGRTTKFGHPKGPAQWPRRWSCIAPRSGHPEGSESSATTSEPSFGGGCHTKTHQTTCVFFISLIFSSI